MSTQPGPPKAVFKFQIPILVSGDVTHIKMPDGAQILSVQMQGGSIALWALVDEMAPLRHRAFLVLWTGHEFYFSEKMSYIGTVQNSQAVTNPFVWHIFEIKEA